MRRKGRKTHVESVMLDFNPTSKKPEKNQENKACANEGTYAKTSMGNVKRKTNLSGDKLKKNHADKADANEEVGGGAGELLENNVKGKRKPSKKRFYRKFAT